jgi:hypothetical protein
MKRRPAAPWPWKRYWDSGHLLHGIFEDRPCFRRRPLRRPVHAENEIVHLFLVARLFQNLGRLLHFFRQRLE